MKETDAYNALKLASESLALILSAHLAVVTALLASPKKCGAKVLRAARDIHQTIRQHLKVLYQLRAQALQSDLKTNPTFRAQVARDLGGKLAMIKWERRRRDAHASAAFKVARQAQGLDYDCPSHSPELINSQAASSSENSSFSKHAPRLKNNAEPRKRWQPKTDRTGHFRWAVIATGPRKEPRKITERIVKINRGPNRPFQPIGLTAHDLRAPAFTALDSPYNSQPPHIGMPLAGVSPLIERWPI